MIRKKPVIILLMSLAFMIYGFSNGEVTVVLRKAIQVCFECIGVG